jgi:hypothetical protein
MSFHPQQTLSSLGHLGSFYTIYEWIGIWGVSIFKHQGKKRQNARLHL